MKTDGNTAAIMEASDLKLIHKQLLEVKRNKLSFFEIDKDSLFLTLEDAIELDKFRKSLLISQILKHQRDVLFINWMRDN